MRVLLFHPWGRFDPLCCSASRVLCAQVDYFRERGCEVHCVVPEVPAWGVNAADRGAMALRLRGVKSVRTIHLDCPAVAHRSYGDELRRLLDVNERAAHATTFRAIAGEGWDAFFTTDVTAAPLAWSLPRGCSKVLAVGDNYTRRSAAAIAPSALRQAEERFTFARIEAELYRLFDGVLFSSQDDTLAAERHGVKTALHAPIPIAEPAPLGREPAGEHDLLICGGTRSGEEADLEWFYRHLYVPHLRSSGVRLAVAGPVAERFAVTAPGVTKLTATAEMYHSARVVVAPSCESPGPCMTVMNALAAGRTVLTTPVGMRGIEAPEDSAIVIDVRHDPQGAAAVILKLLAAPGWRRALGERARRVTQQHTRERFFHALDTAYSFHRPLLALATAS